MNLQQYIVAEARQAADEAFKFAKAVPADKLDWTVEGARSVLAICRELALTPTWTLMAFGIVPSYASEQERQAQRREQETWLDVEACQAEFNRCFQGVEELFMGFTDEDLQKTKWLPFNGGRDHTYLEMMDYPRWNCTYHQGQIAYIQTMYGDSTNY